MFEDLRNGKLRLPVSDLDRHGVTRADLEQGRDTPGARALISATASSARAALVESERIIGEVDPDYRPFLRYTLGVPHNVLDDVGTLGVAVIRRPYHDGKMANLRMMVRSRRMGTSTEAVAGRA
ncbi:squalene/phytoene synthase family protein [Nocardia sp. NBC_00881]|uniref:squalene/phytoene synthase family protein n=1 Tax=Nocardia sp. NBC_00881 TaxID=2975995 RepID=UPI0038664D14|nr:squalene/phytoene synthase family protein [Nocardia sp. NBC_00881]